MRLVLRRQLQRTAELGRGLVDREAGDIGRDLEQDMARLTEIDRAEIIPVALFRGADAVVLNETAHHLPLRGVIGRPEGDMVDRARALPGRQEAAGDAQVDHPADRRALRGIADQRVLAPDLGETENVAEDGPRRCGIGQQQADAVEAAQPMLGGNAAVSPSRLLLDTGQANKGEPHAVRIAEAQHGLAEALDRHLMRHALLDEAMRPEADRTFRNPEDRLLRLADAEAARSGMLPREEGQDRAGRGIHIAEIEVIGAGIVEIDGLLDEAQAEHPSIEVEIAARRARDGGDVMKAVDLHGKLLRVLDPDGQISAPLAGRSAWKRPSARGNSLH